MAAAELGIDSNAVLVASTGVIGQQMDMDKLSAGVVRALKYALAHIAHWHSERELTAPTLFFTFPGA